MLYDVARSVRTGLYWARSPGGEQESFSATGPAQAVAFGDAHRSHASLRDHTQEPYSWEEYEASDEE